MQKVVAAAFVESGLIAIGWYLAPPAWFGPLIIGTTAFLGCLTLMLYRAEIREWLDPNERIIRRGETKRHREQRALQRERVRTVRQNPFLHDVTYDGDTIEAVLKPRRTWRKRMVRCAVWAANHQMLPEWALRRLGRLLGYGWKQEGRAPCQSH